MAGIRNLSAAEQAESQRRAELMESDRKAAQAEETAAEVKAAAIKRSRAARKRVEQRRRAAAETEQPASVITFGESPDGNSQSSEKAVAVAEAVEEQHAADEAVRLEYQKLAKRLSYVVEIRKRLEAGGITSDDVYELNLSLRVAARVDQPDAHDLPLGLLNAHCDLRRAVGNTLALVSVEYKADLEKLHEESGRGESYAWKWLAAAVELASKRATPPDPEKGKPKKKAPGKNINTRMGEAIEKDGTRIGWTSAEWARFLGCATSTVCGTEAWRKYENLRLVAKYELRKDRHRKPKASEMWQD